MKIKKRGTKEFAGGAEKKRMYKEMKWWKKCKELAEILFSKGIDQKEGNEKRKRRLPKARWTLGNIGRWFLLSIMFGRSLVGVNAASENAQYRSGQMISMQEETEVNASSWEQTIPMRPRQEERKDRKEVQKESRMIRVYLVQWVDVEH